MSDNIYKDLTQLGGASDLPESPEKAELERVPNPKKEMDYLVYQQLMTGQGNKKSHMPITTADVRVTPRRTCGAMTTIPPTTEPEAAEEALYEWNIETGEMIYTTI